jgi:hypothetical protein
MYPQRMFFGTVCLLLAMGAASRAELIGHHCPACGCHQLCKRCKLETGTKKETKTEYCCECEDICIPGHSKKCGVKVECDCDGKHRTVIWQPRCGHIRTIKKLVKKEVTKQVPAYKCVVEYYCPQCGACGDRAERPATVAEIAAGRVEEPVR